MHAKQLRIQHDDIKIQVQLVNVSSTGAYRVRTSTVTWVGQVQRKMSTTQAYIARVQLYMEHMYIEGRVQLSEHTSIVAHNTGTIEHTSEYKYNHAHEQVQSRT
jgi:hypothetical protein